ncbi:MAG: 50S ribosomal protein L1 [Patescibacteria group bacterium]
MPRSKRYSELKKLIDPKKLYTPSEAIPLAKKTSAAKFPSAIEVHVNLGIDVKKSDQQIRFNIVLPHAAGKIKKIAAFVPADKEKEAKDAGADLVGAEDLIETISKTGKIEFDVAVATPDMMAKLAKLAKILGPKGIMPNPKTETVGANVKKMIEELKKGRVTIKNDSTANIHLVIGKTTDTDEALLENFNTLITSIRKSKPASAKGVFLKNVVLTSTMGPGIKADISSL